jgi:vacuolar-type H+-ATPase subunit I/STV1
MSEQDSTNSEQASSNSEEQMRVLAEQLQLDLDLKDFLEGALADLRIEPTQGARLMLLVPLAEAKAREDFERGNVEHSLYDLLEEIAERPATVDQDLEERKRRNRVRSSREEPRPRSSVSAIKAFSQRFCSVPPFCGQRDV